MWSLQRSWPEGMETTALSRLASILVRDNSTRPRSRQNLPPPQEIYVRICNDTYQQSPAKSLYVLSSCRSLQPFFTLFSQGLMLYPLENGILSPLYAATTEEGASLNGKVRAHVNLARKKFCS